MDINNRTNPYFMYSKIMLLIFTLTMISLTSCEDEIYQPVDKDSESSISTLKSNTQTVEDLIYSQIEQLSGGPLPSGFQISNYSNSIPASSDLYSVVDTNQFQVTTSSVQFSLGADLIQLNIASYQSEFSTGSSLEKYETFMEAIIDNDVISYKIEFYQDPSTGEVTGVQKSFWGSVREWASCYGDCIGRVLDTDELAGKYIAVLGIAGGAGCTPCGIAGATFFGFGAIGCLGGC